MKGNLSKLQNEKGLAANMNRNLKIRIINNKDDLVEGTFCYSLFESAIFDSDLLNELISDSECFFNRNGYDKEVADVLSWLVKCVNQCFLSNGEKNDLYFIKNYSTEMESKWNDYWEPKIKKLLEKNIMSNKSSS
ncbi:hypothetical protein OSR40_012955 [Serratia rubidaea]|uniref:hypothetical protein n=1 Tax=Serratia rubidaea TaxID=61652 RepID=UPI0023B20015|nr:hypothetical protein [Serratia rubidaea]MDK1704643.1 hypothetical protein [Serratia rubidaea]